MVESPVPKTLSPVAKVVLEDWNPTDTHHAAPPTPPHTPSLLFCNASSANRRTQTFSRWFFMCLSRILRPHPMGHSRYRSTQNFSWWVSRFSAKHVSLHPCSEEEKASQLVSE